MTDEERSTAPPLLLREGRVYRDVPLGPRLRARRTPRTLQPRTPFGPRRPATLAPSRRWTHMRKGWRARSRAVINLLDPDVVVLGGGMSNLPACRPGVRPAAQVSLLRHGSDQGRPELRTAIRAGCAGRRGCGPQGRYLHERRRRPRALSRPRGHHLPQHRHGIGRLRRRAGGVRAGSGAVVGGTVRLDGGRAGGRGRPVDLRADRRRSGPRMSRSCRP